MTPLDRRSEFVETAFTHDELPPAGSAEDAPVDECVFLNAKPEQRDTGADAKAGE
jgi:hypothetical protein